MNLSHSAFPGKVALVTGAGKRGVVPGTGFAASVLLARHGARVAVVDINAAAAEATVEAIRGERGEACAIEADLRESAQCREAVEKTLAINGQIDVLVNNVGIGGEAVDLVTLDEENWALVMDVNARSVALMMKFALPKMPTGSAIVNVSSVAVEMANEAILYTASKAAVEGITHSSALQCGKLGVRVNCVRPGEFWGSFVAERLSDEEGTARFRAARIERNVLKQEGSAWDVAHAVLFLASGDAQWITGQVLTVDGGGNR